jgi:hypothetical protein
MSLHPKVALALRTSRLTFVGGVVGVAGLEGDLYFPGAVVTLDRPMLVSL